MAKHKRAQGFAMFVINAFFLMGVVIVAQEINRRNIAPTQTVAETQYVAQVEVSGDVSVSDGGNDALPISQSDTGFWGGLQTVLESNPTLIAGTLFGLAIAAAIYGIYVFVKPVNSDAYYA